MSSQILSKKTWPKYTQATYVVLEVYWKNNNQAIMSGTSPIGLQPASRCEDIMICSRYLNLNLHGYYAAMLGKNQNEWTCFVP